MITGLDTADVVGHNISMTTAPVTVSNSEVLEYQKCKRAHFYHFGLGLEPKVPPIRFDRGTTGHKAIELATLAKMNGASLQDCINIAASYIANRSLKFMQDPGGLDRYQQEKRTEMFTELLGCVTKYITYYWHDVIRPILIEETFKVPINSRVNYGMRVDVFGQYIAGPYKGDYVVDDWKFRYNFISERLLSMNGQLHKYIFGLKAQGYIVTKGVFDQIRYRMLKDSDPEKMLKREPLKVKPVVREGMIETQVAVAEEIATVKVLPIVEQSKRAVRTLNEWACKDCIFFSLCETELRGQDPSMIISQEYKPSEYGYVEEESLAF